jgi:hypothetical protein
MGRFSNAKEYESWRLNNCSACLHNQQQDGCPILDIHFWNNHDQSEATSRILDRLIPRDETLNKTCPMRIRSMYEPVRQTLPAQITRTEAVPSVESVNLLNLKQTSKILGVSEKTVWCLTKNGELSCVRIGHLVKYEPNELKKFIENHRSGNVNKDKK